MAEAPEEKVELTDEQKQAAADAFTELWDDLCQELAFGPGVEDQVVSQVIQVTHSMSAKAFEKGVLYGFEQARNNP